MGHAATAFREGIDTTVGSPAYVGVAAAAFVTAAVVSLVLNLTLGLVPLVGQLLASVLNSVVVGPLLAAGVLGMAYAASLGRGAPGTFVVSIKRRGKSIMGAYALLFAGGMTVTLVGTVGIVAVGVFAIGFSGSMAGPGVSGMSSALFSGTGLALVGLTLLFALLVAFAMMVLQFVGVAVVVDGESATSSFGASWRAFRENSVSVFGYTLLRALPSLVVLVVAGALFYAGSQVDTTTGLVLGGAGFVVLGAVNFAFLSAYHVAYYQRIAA